ncbi:MAG: DUF5668 domain-containing protein [Patescibacteria group bacterium]
MFGVALIVVGAVFLLKNLGIISGFAWDVVWPILVIVIGAAMLLKKK